MEPQRFLTEKTVTALTTLHRTQIARLVKAGKFPKPIYISDRRKAWLEHEVATWMQVAASRRGGRA